MSKKPRSQHKKNRTKPEQRGQSQMKRLWITFGAALVVELFLLLLYRYYVNGTIKSIVAVYNALPVLMKVFPIAAALCAVVALVMLAMKRAGLSNLFWTLTVVFLALWGADYVVMLNYGEGIKFLCTAVAAAAVLVLIFHVYQREFFISSLVTMGGIAALWVYRRSAIWGIITPRVYAVYALGLVLLLLCAVLARRAQRGRGLMTIQGESVRVFSSLCHYWLIYLSCAVVAVVMLASFLFGNMAAFLSIFILAVYFFALAVYSTVKLM